jgi:hypothetical protein
MCAVTLNGRFHVFIFVCLMNARGQGGRERKEGNHLMGRGERSRRKKEVWLFVTQT